MNSIFDSSVYGTYLLAHVLWYCYELFLEYTPLRVDIIVFVFVCTFSWTRRILKPAGYFCLLISSLRLGCLGRPQETILVGYFPPRSQEIFPDTFGIS